MSDCDQDRSLPGNVQALAGRWVREFVSTWVDETREATGESSGALNLLSSVFSTAPISAGRELANAAGSADSARMNDAIQNVLSMPADQSLEAACYAKLLNEAQRRENADTPRLDIVTSRLNDRNPAVESIAVSLMQQVARGEVMRR